MSPVTLPTGRTPGCPFDSPAELTRLRADDPVTPLAYPDGHVGWLVTGYDAARTVLADVRFSTRPELKRSPLGAVARPGGPRQPAAPGWFINMLALGTFALLLHPEELAALRADPGLTDTAVEELLRYLSIVHLGAPTRAALEDVELAGRPVAEGETVTLSLPAANWDPAEFPEPDRIRLDRPNARRHLAFGHGVHQCLGQQLARIELRIGYRALFERFPSLRLADPANDIPLRENSAVYGVWRLPVSWD